MRKSSAPTTTTIAIDVSAQRGIFAVEQHPGDQSDRREEVEHAMGEHRADEGRRRAPSAWEPPPQDGDSGELADAARQDRVREQPDGEGGEDEREARVRRLDRLLDGRVPRERAREDGEKVEADRRGDPFPGHRGERVVHDPPVRAAPDDQRDGDRDHRRGNEQLPAAFQAATSS